MRIDLDIPLNIKEAEAALSGRIKDIKDGYNVGGISTDSRTLKQNDLFFGLPGKNTNGGLYAEEAYLKGAVPVTESDVPGIKVNNVSEALLSLAEFYKAKLENLKYTVAITGSIGKTTTKEFLKIILEGAYKVHATKGNLNNIIGLPLTILSAPRDTDVLILEMGMNHIGEISALSKCARPDIGIITNIGTSHIGNLGTKENIAKAKLEILDGMISRKIVVPKGEELIPEFPEGYTFSSHSPAADVYIIYNEGKVKAITPKGEILSDLNLTAPYTAECLGASLASALLCGEDLDIIARQISLISDKNTRQSVFKTDNFYILSDYYNSSLESVISALEYLTCLSGYTEKSALLGDILELGEISRDIHMLIGGACAKVGLSKLYIFGKYGKYIKEGALGAGMSESKIFLNSDLSSPEITSEQISENSIPNEIILFKASNKAGLDKVFKILYKKSGGKTDE